MSGYLDIWYLLWLNYVILGKVMYENNDMAAGKGASRHAFRFAPFIPRGLIFLSRPLPAHPCPLWRCWRHIGLLCRCRD